jgi:hypothetical protein
MAAAVAEAHRVLRDGGLLLDIHPTDEPSFLQVWVATSKDGAIEVDAANLDAVVRTHLGPLEHDAATRKDFTAATDALVESLDHSFDLAAVKTFEYQYFFDTLDELTDYLEDNHEHARAGDELLERAALVMHRAPNPPKLVIVQRTVVSALRKI